MLNDINEIFRSENWYWKAQFEQSMFNILQDIAQFIM